jgi:hypothetical protein
MQTDDEQTATASLEQDRCFALTIAYDGTRYAGWQIQPNGTFSAIVLPRFWGIESCSMGAVGPMQESTLRGKSAHFVLLVGIMSPAS